MNREDQIVFVIDDDPSMRQAIKTLIETVGLKGETFVSGQEFLQSTLPEVPRCLVLDVRLPGLGGLNLQGELSDGGVQIPIIFITGNGDMPMYVQGMTDGAGEFCAKRFLNAC